MSSSAPTEGSNPKLCEICGEEAIPQTTVCQFCMPVVAHLKRFIQYPNGRTLIRLVLNTHNRERRNVGEAAVREL